MYVVLISYYDIILSMLWIRAQDVRINRLRSEMKIITTSVVVRSKDAFSEIEGTISKAVNVLAAAFQLLQTCIRKSQTNQEIAVFAASIADINKALAAKRHTDLRKLLPK